MNGVVQILKGYILLVDTIVTGVALTIGENADLVLMLVYRVGIRLLNEVSCFVIVWFFLKLFYATLNGVGIITFLLGLAG
jgi:hypothetical protein